jgi:hypothetical protein
MKRRDFNKLLCALPFIGSSVEQEYQECVVLDYEGDYLPSVRPKQYKYDRYGVLHRRVLVSIKNYQFVKKASLNKDGSLFVEFHLFDKFSVDKTQIVTGNWKIELYSEDGNMIKVLTKADYRLE